MGFLLYWLQVCLPYLFLLYSAAIRCCSGVSSPVDGRSSRAGAGCSGLDIF